MNKDNIILIGMPGAGKSTVGVVLAKKLGYAFVDSDLVIQEKTGKLLYQLIEELGEAGFLVLENEVNASLCVQKTVIATGGSAVYGKEAMEYLGRNGQIVYLKLPYEELEERLGDLHERGVVLRPGFTLRDLFTERTSLYERYYSGLWRKKYPAGDGRNCRKRNQREMKKAALRSSLLLFMAASIWGVAFVAQSVGMDYMGPFTFNGARFLMGSMVLLPLVVYRRKQKTKEEVFFGSRKDTLTGGVCCGLALCSAALLQQFGILYTTVGKAGFITTLYIIIVPIMGIFLKKKVPGKIWLAALVAAVGMYLLCMSESLRLGKGDTYVFICAILFSVHILVIDHFTAKADGVELSCVQFFTAGVIGSVLAVIFEKPQISYFIEGIIPLALRTGAKQEGTFGLHIRICGGYFSSASGEGKRQRIRGRLCLERRVICLEN